MNTTVSSDRQFLINTLLAFNNRDDILFGDEISTMAKRLNTLVSNQILYDKFCKKTLKKYRFNNVDQAINVYSALTSIEQNNDQYVLVYLLDIEYYGIFKREAFREFAENICDRLDISVNKDDMTKISTAPKLKQIVLGNCKQKIVMVCSPLHSANVESIARQFFGDKVRTVRDLGDEIIKNNIEDKLVQDVINSPNDVEIVVDGKLFNNYDDMLQSFQKFTTVYGNLDRELINNIHLSHDNAGNNKFVKSTFALDKYDPNNIIKMFVDQIQHTGNVNMNMNIYTINGNNNIVGDANIIKNVPKNEIKEMAVAWITANPPAAGEVTTDYYKRYTDNNKYTIHNNGFGRLVRSAIGKVPVHGTNCRHW